MAAFNKFNVFVQDLANKGHNLGTDTLKIMLTNTLPVATNAVTSDITDLSTANGYTAGGVAVTGVTSSQTSGTEKLVSSADPVVTASGGSIGPFRYAVLHNATASKLIGWWDYGSSITLNTGETFTIDLDQAAGILTIA